MSYGIMGRVWFTSLESFSLNANALPIDPRVNNENEQMEEEEEEEEEEGTDWNSSQTPGTSFSISSSSCKI